MEYFFNHTHILNPLTDMYHICVCNPATLFSITMPMFMVLNGTEKWKGLAIANYFRVYLCKSSH